MAPLEKKSKINSPLNHARLKYVFYHLLTYYLIDSSILERIIFLRVTERSQINKGIIFFPLSENKISPVMIRDIPVLFPVDHEEKPYSLVNDSLVFHHDLLRSVFYFLSGYQEYFPKKRDRFDRFRAIESIQYKYHVLQKPLVNYYFAWIIEGITAFAKIHYLPLPESRNSHPHLFLSHDIDRISYFNPYKLRGKIKFGLRDRNFGEIFRYSRNYIRYKRGKLKDPYWNFDKMLRLEKELHILSTWFVLDKGELHLDAYFNQDDENVQTLLETIQTAGHEIGLHGVIHSAESNRIMAEQKTTLNQILEQQVFGVRQHFLRYKIPETAKIHKKQHFLYDATLGFATYEGFRNGISYPFKLYNFDEEKAFPQWEIPMIVMDRTLLAYRKMNYQTARKHLNNIISEVEKFNGVFSLLWHNGYLNELEQKGITRFYTDILDSLPDTFQKKVTGKQIIKAYQHNIHNFSTIADKIHE